MNLKEQYELLLHKVITHSEGKHGSMFDDAFICNRIKELDLIHVEMRTLMEDFQSRKPSENQYVEFYNHKLFYKKEDSWWNCRDEHTKESNEQRILFLKQIISEL